MTRVRTQTRWLAAAIMLTSTLALAGCFGVWQSKGKPSLAKTREEVELVRNAALAKESTQPVWDLGRYAFVPGEDRLLVVTRITSWPDANDPNLPNIKDPSLPQPEYKDRRIERVWIVIPKDTPIGHEIKLDELEANFLVGYDAGDVGDGFYAQPNKLLGSVIIKEDTGDHVVLDIDVVSEPQRMSSWRVERIGEVPVTDTGIRATKAVNLDRATIVGRKQRDINFNEAPTISGLAPTTQPVAAATANNQLGDRSVAGKWEATGQGYKVRLQLRPDNRFSLATGKGDGADPALIQQGSYEVRGDFLMLRGDKSLDQGGGQGTNMESIRAKWNGDSLVLSGPVVPNVTQDLTFSAGNYSDLPSNFTQSSAGENN
ncbi:MAG: hypothetical protein IT444_08345 [Phycisphaeraceae bacterium]|nr:hypothetical protein [Phycisphaeraceae bacterium]